MSAPAWVKVEFYGLLPRGLKAVHVVDPLATAAVLAQPFGFTHVDALAVTPTTAEGRDPHVAVLPGGADGALDWIGRTS